MTAFKNTDADKIRSFFFLIVRNTIFRNYLYNIYLKLIPLFFRKNVFISAIIILLGGDLLMENLINKITV